MFGLLSKNKEGIFNVGLLEMAIALYPIIAGYGYVLLNWLLAFF